MKTKILMLIIGALMIATGVFAGPGNLDVNRKVMSSFNSKFTNASEVTWSKTDSYLKASFKIDNQFLFAYYKEDGELLAVSRNIITTQLPMVLKNSLKHNYSNNWISELFEFATEDLTMYVATVENGDEKVTLKSTDGRNWETSNRIKKP